MEDKENEEYKKWIIENLNKRNNNDLLGLIRDVKESKDLGEYQKLLEKIEEVKQTGISMINKASRNEKVIIGYVFLIREYYMLRFDPNSPFRKDQFQVEIDALYKLIYKELQKPKPYTPDTWDIDEKKRILNNMRIVLGTENMNQFYKKYKIHRLVRLKLHMRKGFQYYAYCWIITVIILFTILFIQRL